MPEEKRKDVRCSECSRYIKIPSVHAIPPDFTTQTLISAANDNFSGKLLASRFRVESLIADGAMGHVYRGTDILLRRPIAIKILKSLAIPEAQQDRCEKRFLTEAKIGSELIHPGIVPVRSVHKLERGSLFFVMDFCPGRSLRSILAERKLLPVAEAVEIARQILVALKVAHEKGVVHRDIKPGNIMINQIRGKIQVKILDFGIAKVISEIGGLGMETLTRTGCIIGTTRYMAPEQILGTNVGVTTDIYAVGCLLYYMICGMTPFNGSRQKILRAILHADPTPLREVCSTENVTLFLDETIVKSLAKNPLRRFQSATEFLNALALYDKPISQRIIPTLRFASYRAFRQASMRWKMALASIFLCITAIVLYSGLLSPYFRHRNYVEKMRYYIQTDNYTEALATLPELQTVEEEREFREWQQRVLAKAFLAEYKRGNQQQALDYLERLKESGEVLAEHLHLFLSEEMVLLEAEQALQNRDYARVEQLLDSSITSEIEFYKTRQELRQWLKNWKNIQKEE